MVYNLNRPNYFVIGATKAASSSVCTLLGQHPDVFMVACKEPCFFNEDDNYYTRGWSWYESLYIGSENCKRRGEGTVRYSMKELWPHTAERIARDIPDAKLIYLVRDPLPRIESLWMQKRANGDATHPDFNRAVMESPDILVDSTNYLRQLEPYQQRFPEEQIKVVFFEDFKHDWRACMADLFSYLDVDPTEPLSDNSSHLNPSVGKLVLSPMVIHIRRTTWLRPIKRLLPNGLKHHIRDRFFQQPILQRPTWRADTIDFVMERIADDTAELLTRCGKPQDFWSTCRQSTIPVVQSPQDHHGDCPTPEGTPP